MTGSTAIYLIHEEVCISFRAPIMALQAYVCRWRYTIPSISFIFLCSFFVCGAIGLSVSVGVWICLFIHPSVRVSSWVSVRPSARPSARHLAVCIARHPAQLSGISPSEPRLCRRRPSGPHYLISYSSARAALCIIRNGPGWSSDQVGLVCRRSACRAAARRRRAVLIQTRGDESGAYLSAVPLSSRRAWGASKKKRPRPESGGCRRVVWSG